MTNSKGTLFVVATPIGNLGDISARALEVLADVALILAEDTRHSGRLLKRFGIATPTRALHEHNERRVVEGLVARIEQGEDMALICNAGTPLISDPGFLLVRRLRELRLEVAPVPGANAALSALSVAGLPVDRFCFEGFLPSKGAARRRRLDALRREPRTLIFYEAPHRIRMTLNDLADAFGGAREATLARELTKQFETTFLGTLSELVERLERGADACKGEFVLVVRGAPEEDEPGDDDALLRELLSEMPVRQAVAIVARLTGAKRNAVYKRALAIAKT